MITGTRRTSELLFQIAALSALVMALAALAVLLLDVFKDGVGRLSWDFLTGFPSRHAGEAGIYHALMGTLWVIGLTAAMALPIGVASAVFLEEYGSRSRLAKFIEINIANLAAVPSIIYGLLGLGLFVRFMGMGRSVMAGSATLALLALPVVILSTREALRTVPGSIREGSYALGATKWQTIWNQVLPMALPGIMTGLILALSRAIGETAPLLTIGALTYVPFAPDGPWSPFTVLPIQIFNWVSRPQADFRANAAAGILVLLVVLLTMNGLAVVLRDRFQQESIVTSRLPSLSAVANRHTPPGGTAKRAVKIDVRDMNFYYGAKRALDGISIRMESNLVTAFIGPSGCGKSTFLRTLNRMNDIIPDTRVEGAVEVDGKDIYGPGVDVVELRRRVGMVFQKSNPFPKSIFENVAYGLRINSMARTKAELADRVEESLRAAAIFDEVKDRLHDSALALSGGQQQRLCIARALAIRPEILLMDEPASALDPIATQRIEELIYDLKKAYTIVIVTHNMQQAARVSDHTAFFWLGRLVEFDRTDKIFTAPAEKLTEDYVTGRCG